MKPDIPPPPKPPAMPNTEAEKEARKQAEMARRRRAAGSTVLTSGQGLGSPAPTKAKTLLGG